MRYRSYASLLAAAALMFLQAVSAQAQSCNSLATCAQSAKDANTLSVTLWPLLGNWFLVYDNPLQSAPSYVPVGGSVGSYLDHHEFTKSTSTQWDLYVKDLGVPFEFFPRNRQGVRLDFSQGATIAVMTQVNPNVSPPDEGELFGANHEVGHSSTTEPLLAFGQASQWGWYLDRRLRALGDTQSVMSRLLPWDPVPDLVDWAVIYVTFQADGKLRIDQLSLTSGEWDSVLLEDGWPIEDLGQADANGNVPAVSYFDWHRFYVGPANGNVGVLFGALTVFDKALTPQEVLAFHWSLTSLSNLEFGMHPCNTGSYIGSASAIDTPCGPRSPL